MENSISDHDLVYVILRLKKARSKPVYITTRSVKHYSPVNFNSDVSLQLAPWSIVDVFDDVEGKLYAFDLPFTEKLVFLDLFLLNDIFDQLRLCSIFLLLKFSFVH